MNIGKYRLDQTCGACPEQYDVYLGEEQVGYLRLRGGSFRADFPTCGGETVFQGYPEGDGIFDEEERYGYLCQALAAIDKKLFERAVKEKQEATE